jgi:hypothetical protein
MKTEFIKINKLVMILIFISSSPLYGQVLHHQMISSQGNTIKTSEGLLIRQSIGQQSAVGNFNKDYLVQQGFQQALWVNYLSTNYPLEITVTSYPNPFSTLLNFNFSKQINSTIRINVFDFSGKLVHEDSKINSNELVNIDLAHLASGCYLVRLISTDFIYHSQIIRK